MSLGAMLYGNLPMGFETTVVDESEKILVFLLVAIPMVMLLRLIFVRRQRRSIEDARKVSLAHDPNLAVVGIVLINGIDFPEDHVMVQLKKPRTPEIPILYGPPGGGYEIDDHSVFDGACREFLEETGMDLRTFPDSVLSYEGYTVTDVGRGNGRIVYNFYLRVMARKAVFQWENSGIDMESELMIHLPHNCCKGHVWEKLNDVRASNEYSYSRMKKLLLMARSF